MKDEQEALQESLRALSQFFVNDGTLGDTLQRVSEMACEVTPAKYAGITIMVEGKPRTGIFTNIEAPEIDAAQYESGEGPCLQAFRDQKIYRIDSTHDEARWPEFAATAAAHGIGSTLSVPMTARGESMGALNLYADSPNAFTGDHERRVQMFADQASYALVNAQVYWDVRQLSENLGQAIKSRETIDHAVGILMAGGGRPATEAFQILVRASQRENRKVRDIAEDIVTRTIERRGNGAT
ncbi:MAG TPA: GAF and ANTAR domain-containing protein [Acidimicrobiales bacterium]|jgi:GAF domain-containing protein|nr:GAF and ANTAR domain-containing protein [Acidimicrobiales bacterium]